MFHKFDFLSEPPKNFIFQKSSNETNFGGFCFIIYMLFIIAIVIYSLIDFFYLSEKYTIEYSLNYYTQTIDSINLKNSDPDYNPSLNFTLNLYKNDGKMSELSDRFLLVDPIMTQINDNLALFKRNTTINKRVSGFNVGIAYNCSSDPNCIINSEDEIELNYILRIECDSYKINHQDTYKPLEKQRVNCIIPFFYYNIQIGTLNWQNIIYKQNIKGIDLMRGLESNKVIGFIESYSSFPPNKVVDDIQKTKALGFFNIQNYHLKNVEYRRTGRNELDILAEIGSLIINILEFLKLIFGFILKILKIIK